MAPPITPSPHRFVIKKEHSQSKLSGSQFNITPRFNLSSTPQKQPTRDHLRPSQFLLHDQTPVNKRSKGQAAIEIESDDSSGTEAKEPGYLDFRNKIEDQRNKDDIEEPVPKKRRQSTSPEPLDHSLGFADEVEMLTDDSENHFSPSPLPNPFSSIPLKRPASTKAPRFLIPSSNVRSTSQVLSESSIFVKPPQFRPQVSPTNPNPQSDPNPDQFSPGRKGEKYMHAGLAAWLRNRLVNIKSSVLEIQAMNYNPWIMNVLIEEFVEERRGRMILVRGKQLENLEDEAIKTPNDVRVILAGQVSNTGLDKISSVKNGGVVRIKVPVWEIFIDGEKWSVAVEWQLI